MPPVDAPSTLAALGVGFLVLVHLGFRALERRRALIGIPRSAAGGVHIGLNRVQGSPRAAGETLVSPLTSTACAGWSVRVEDERRRDSIWRWRRRARWHPTAEDHAEADFDLVDGTGDIRVRIEGAAITGLRTFGRVLREGDADFAALAAAPDRNGSTGRRRVTELVIPLAAPTTIVGTARLRDDIPRPEIAWDRGDRTLLVSCVGEGVSTTRELVVAIWLVLAALGALAVSPLAIVPSDTEYWDAVDASGRWIPTLVLGAIVVLAAHWFRYVYNDLIVLRERVERARSLIAVELQRRHDLLPSLADVVRAASAHEREVLPEIAETRADPARRIGELAEIDRLDSGAVERLVAVAEELPKLSANDSYRELHAAIVGSEDRLALARAFYNDSVTIYSDRIGELPALLVARLFRFTRARLYESLLDRSQPAGAAGSVMS
jgi:hypothetical protein